MSPGAYAYGTTCLFGHSDLEVIAPDVARDEIGFSQNAGCKAAPCRGGYLLVAARNQVTP